MRFKTVYHRIVILTQRIK